VQPSVRRQKASLRWRSRAETASCVATSAAIRRAREDGGDSLLVGPAHLGLLRAPHGIIVGTLLVVHPHPFPLAPFLFQPLPRRAAPVRVRQIPRTKI